MREGKSIVLRNTGDTHCLLEDYKLPGGMFDPSMWKLCRYVDTDILRNVQNIAKRRINAKTMRAQTVMATQHSHDANASELKGMQGMKRTVVIVDTRRRDENICKPD